MDESIGVELFSNVSSGVFTFRLVKMKALFSDGLWYVLHQSFHNFGG